MNNRDNVGAVDNYLASLDTSSIKKNEGFNNSYISGLTSKTEEYIETTKTTAESNLVAEYESTKIIKCRRYKLYKAGK